MSSTPQPPPAQTRVLAIDTCNLIARYFYANPAIRPAQIVTAIHRLKQQHAPTHLVAALEGRSSWREKLCETHKNNRAEKVPELRELFDMAPSIMAQAGARLLCGDELEADDVLGCVARRHTGETLIVSNDKDLYSVLSPNVAVILGGKLFSSDELLAKYRLTPAQWPLYRAIVGDKSDNHPGVSGLGKAAALTVVAHALTPEQALDWAATQHNRTARLLTEQADNLRLYYHLACLKDADLQEVPPPPCSVNDQAR